MSCKRAERSLETAAQFPIGQGVGDYIGARAFVSSLPNVDWLLGTSRDLAAQGTAEQ